MSGTVSVEGTVAAGFEGVRDAFAQNFAEYDEVGAACAVYVGGCKVVDLWGGIADVRSARPYTDDTLQLVFSTTKGLTALCANLLVQRGELDLDAPVARYWPEFGQAGKGEVTVRSLLCHKAGLPYVEADLTLGEALAWDPVVEALAGQAPVWPPGTAHGYHAVTYGWLVGEVIRRVTGRSVGTFFAEEVAGPLGLDLWIGLPHEQRARVAPLAIRGLQDRPPSGAGTGMGTGAGAAPAGPGGSAGSLRATGPVWPAGASPAGAPDGDDDGDDDDTSLYVEKVEQVLGPASMLIRTLGGVSGSFLGHAVLNQPEVWAAELPSINAIGDARSIARMYAAIVGPVEDATAGPLLAGDQVTAASTCQTTGDDQVLQFPTTFGLGFMTASRYARFGGARAFGHFGGGGSVGFADPKAGIGFAYAMNRMLAGLSGDPRSRNLIRATYEALDLPPTYL
jgi:CubicO group peptidase (beta-lactamase class C family)